MIAQAWNIYAMASPIVEGFFGIQPKAYSKEVTIAPNMPSQWETASLDKVKVGENEISINKITDGDDVVYTITQRSDWAITFQHEGSNPTVNGESHATEGDDFQITFTDKEARIEFKK